MMKDNIVLIGMPGVGKSTVGVILAKVLGYQFMDADLLIQKEEGKLLREIIEERGTEGFIRVENRVNASIQADHARASLTCDGIGSKALSILYIRDLDPLIFLDTSRI